MTTQGAKSLGCLLCNDPQLDVVGFFFTIMTDHSSETTHQISFYVPHLVGDMSVSLEY